MTTEYRGDIPACYVVITPVRDEAEHIVETIRSLAEQTVRPEQWIIVDDGSSDDTGAIIDRYAGIHPWITCVHRSNRGFRDPDIGAIGAFLEGCDAIRVTDWQFIVNLDGDLSLAPAYFERCFDEFTKDPRLGIGGGTLLLHSPDGLPVVERVPEFHVRGATKIYRKACWDAIGGLAAVPGWDTFDEIKANMLGWRTRSFSDITGLHLRPTGAAGGGWRDAVKNGRSDYFLGYHPLFMIAKCLKRLCQRPYLANGLGHFVGYASGYLRRRRRVADKRFVKYLRQQQMRRLLLLDSVWK